jgi:hypothetical protein
MELVLERLAEVAQPRDNCPDVSCHCSLIWNHTTQLRLENVPAA